MSRRGGSRTRDLARLWIAAAAVAVISTACNPAPDGDGRPGPPCTPGEERILVTEDVTGNNWFHLTAFAGEFMIERTLTIPEPITPGRWEVTLDAWDPGNEMPDTPNEQVTVTIGGSTTGPHTDLPPGVLDPAPEVLGSVEVTSSTDQIVFRHVGDDDWTQEPTDSIYIQSVRLRCEGDGNEPNPEIPGIADGTCVGIRGNGARIFAHFGALARLVENYGPIACAAGGSSGSVSTFALESMQANPLWTVCNSGPCSDAERRARLALMMKSFTALVDVGLGADIQTVTAVADGVMIDDIAGLIASGEGTAAVDALVRILRDVGPLINEEVIDLLLTSPDPVFHATEIVTGLQNGVAFVVDTGDVFLRTGILDWPELAEFFGLYGSFYAAYGPSDLVGFDAWLDACAAPSVGLTWADVEALPGPGGQTCASAFRNLFDSYRDAFAADPTAPSRIDDPVGRYMTTFGVTGVLTGDAISAFETARAAWLSADPIEFAPDFADIGIGWWGRTEDLATIAANLPGDLGSRQFVPLGEQPWREVLSASPAEPGFTPAVPLASGAYSVGGWADPARVLPLQALGAEHVVSINRLGGVGGFTANVTELLGASPAELDALYGLTAGSQSSFFLALDRAEGVWCTNWDGPDQSDIDGLFNDAYSSPFLTDDPFFTASATPYLGIDDVAAIVGCQPGLTNAAP